MQLSLIMRTLFHNNRELRCGGMDANVNVPSDFKVT